MILVQATPEMSSERDRATHEAWGGPLAVERYQALERRLRGHGWSREVLRGWLLCAEGGEVLSSCETYRMPSRIEGAPGHSYAIASVYTEPDKRRKGYAAELLSRLGECLAGTGDAQAMILFSDVALHIYEKSGFAARPAPTLRFPSLPGDPGEGVDELFPESRAAQALAWIPLPADPFAILPAPAQIDWHLERERIFSELLGRPRPTACGARIGSSAVLWSADFREGHLTILLFHAPGPEAEALLTCARRAAHAAGLPWTLLWKTPADRPWPGILLEDRADRLDSVPMIRPLDPRLRAEHWRWIPRALWV